MDPNSTPPPAGATPVAGTPGVTPLSIPPAGATPAVSLEDAQKLLAERDRQLTNHTEELERLRKFKAGAEKAQADADAAKLSDIDKATKRAEAAEAEKTALAAKHQQTILHLAMLRTANKVGLTTPEAQDAAIKLLDLGALELDDDGQPKNMEKALNDLIVKYPFLKPAAPTPPPVPPIPPMFPARSAVTTPNQAPRSRPPSMAEAFKLHEQQKQQG